MPVALPTAAAAAMVVLEAAGEAVVMEVMVAMAQRARAWLLARTVAYQYQISALHLFPVTCR